MSKKLRQNCVRELFCSESREGEREREREEREKFTSAPSLPLFSNDCLMFGLKHGLSEIWCSCTSSLSPFLPPSLSPLYVFHTGSALIVHSSQHLYLKYKFVTQKHELWTRTFRTFFTSFFPQYKFTRYPRHPSPFIIFAFYLSLSHFSVVSFVIVCYISEVCTKERKIKVK